LGEDFILIFNFWLVYLLKVALSKEINFSSTLRGFVLKNEMLGGPNIYIFCVFFSLHMMPCEYDEKTK
jgi:hypothetical protein